jgi:hypothetical protein
MYVGVIINVGQVMFCVDAMQFRIVCLPVYLNMQRLKCTKRQFYLLFSMGVKPGLSRSETRAILTSNRSPLVHLVVNISPAPHQSRHPDAGNISRSVDRGNAEIYTISHRKTNVFLNIEVFSAVILSCDDVISPFFYSTTMTFECRLSMKEKHSKQKRNA